MQKMWVVLFSGLFALGVVQTNVFSQGTELALFEEIPIVTIATRTAQEITEAPAAIRVITAEEIAKAGYLNIWDLFRNQPGMYVKQMAGNSISVAVRGFGDLYSSNKLAVYLDGRSVFNPVTQGVWWVHQPIMLEDIERIEIMRGPNSVLYGFNAFNGIISIITKDPQETKGTLVKTTFGTNSTQQYFVRMGDSIDKFDYRLSYQRDNSRGFGDDNGRQQLDGSRLNGFNLRTRYTLSDEKNIEVLVGGKVGNEGPFSRGTTSEEYVETDYQLLRYNQTLSDTSDLKVQFARTYWNVNNDGMPAVLTTFTNGTSVADKEDNQYKQYDFEFQHSFKPHQRHAIVWGANYRRNEARQWLLVDNSNDFNDTIMRVFAQDQISLTDKLTWYTGIEWEENKYTGSDWTTRQTLMYNLIEDHYLRGTFARGVRAHSFIEYFFDLAIQPFPGFTVARAAGTQVPGGVGSVDRERIHAYEFGYRGSFLEKKLLTDAQIFYYEITDSLESVNMGGPPVLTVFTNAQDIVVRGGEIALDYKPRQWLKTYVNYSYLTIKDELIATSFTAPPYNVWERADPTHIANVGGTIFFDRRPFVPDSLDVRFSYVGTTETIDTSNTTMGALPAKVHDYTKLDITLKKKFINDALEVALIGLNLLDDDHFEHSRGSGGAFIAPVDRQFLATVKYEF